MKTVLTIAGFDPSSGAGVTADLAVFAAHGLFGTSCITALTVQSTVGVRAVYPVAGTIIAETLECLAADLPPVGIKIGMLATEAAVEAVVRFLQARRGREQGLTVVLDPVLRSSSGRELLSPAGVARMRGDLLPLVDWVTPNLAELAVLTGVAVENAEDLLNASRALGARYSGLNVVATGGHLEPPDDLVLEAGREPVWLRGERIESRSTHGTGCAFSSALLSGLVLGGSGLEASAKAKRYVAKAIRTATPLGAGRGPINLGGPG